MLIIRAGKNSLTASILLRRQMCVFSSREKHFAQHNARHGYADRHACFAALQLKAGKAAYWQKHEGRADTQCTHQGIKIRPNTRARVIDTRVQGERMANTR